METTDRRLSADRPLVDPRDDRLGFAPYATFLAKVLMEKCPQTGMVIAICGAWGTGKSTIINFIIRSLELLPEQEMPHIIHFSPWLFSGEGDLTARFFDQLLAKFAKWGKRFKSLRRTLADYAEVLEKAPIPKAGLLGPAAKIIRPMQKDVQSLKKDIERLLTAESRRILTVIDDVDRLTAEEVRQLFRVLKAVADFPNVTYLLAFDRGMVIKALEYEQGTDGEAYLEKIVQATFDVPRFDPLVLHQILFEQLDRLLEGAPEKSFEQTRWGNVFHEGIKHFIQTPRDVTRLVNVLSATYPPFINEVNPVDYFAVEALRLFCPSAYNPMRDYPEKFTGVSSYGMHADAERKAVEGFHDSWLKAVPSDQQEAVKRMMIRLFPRLEGIWGNMNYGYDFMAQWRKALRVCSPSRYPVYFQFSLPSGYISNEEMHATLAGADHQTEFEKKLLSLSKERNPDGTSRLRTFLEIMPDYIEKDIPEDNIPSIVSSFLNIGDDLLLECDERRGLYDIPDNRMRIGWIIGPLLKRLSEEERYSLLKSSFTQGKAVAVMTDLTLTLGSQHGLYGEKEPSPKEEWIVSKEHQKTLEILVVERIRAAAADASLLEAPLFAQTLRCWGEWAGDEEVKEWASMVIANDKGLAVFASKFGSFSISHVLSDSVGRRHYHLSPKYLERFVEIGEMIQRARNLVEKKELPEILLAPLGQLVKEADLIAAGQNPDLPWHREED